MKEKLLIGTRGSALALWQAEEAKRQLQEVCDLPVEIKVISTRGDERLEIALHDHQLSKGLFTEELEHELLSGEIDFAVHSLKDLPIDMPTGLVLSAVLERGEVQDALLLYTPTPYPDLSGLRIGTSSPRRMAQLKSSPFAMEGATFASIRGKVETRITKLRSGAYGATILALAGLQRLGLANELDYLLPLDVMLPAPGQGAIGIQCAESNHLARSIADRINHRPTAFATQTERQLLKELGGGCSLPLGAYCAMAPDGAWKLQAAYSSVADLSATTRAEVTFTESDRVEAIKEIVSKLKA